MGRQSSRIFFNTKDHKDIYFNGYYHKAMYITDSECNLTLVWEKLPEETFEFWIQDTMINAYGETSIRFQNGEVELYIRGVYEESLTIDWGDGTVSRYGFPYHSIRHTYPTSDFTEYLVKVYGKIIRFNATSFDEGCITQMTTPLPSTITDFSFYRAKSLRKICDYFFSALKDTDIKSGFTFSGTGLKEVPSFIFSGLEDINIGGCFSDCKDLDFVSSSAFFGGSYLNGIGLFSGCENLKLIPSTLFTQGFENAVSFDYCFANASGLTEIPINLFHNCDSAKSFNETFYWCSNVTTAVPELWTIQDAVGDDCYFNCVRAENYWEIPTTWR